MMNVPIIRVELEGLKLGISRALSEQAIDISLAVQKAIDAYTSQEHLDSIIFNMARCEIDEAVKDEVRAFFRYSKTGRKAIREAVIKALDENDKFYIGHQPS